MCIKAAAWRRSLAIRHTRPERFLTLTLVGEDWQTVRARMFRYRHDLVSELGEVEWVWAVEKNPRGTGHHVHAWQRGDFLDQAELSKMARRRGMGERVDIRRWTPGGEGYGLKEAYAVKGVRQAESYLSINGGRLTHQTRGYFRGPVREAEKAAIRQELGGDAPTWVVCTLAELHAAHGRAPR